jgi:ATP-binding cassette subfamily B protein
MAEVRRIIQFVKPYKRLAILSLILLVVLVFSDLAIPLLIERLIDEGIRQNDMQVVLQTSAIMLSISVMNTILAVLNSIFSVRTGESVARDFREAIFLKIQQFSYRDLDRFDTGKLMVRLTSDASAVQRLVQVSLRIGTRAPLLMVGSIILMFITSRTLATAMIPLLVIVTVMIVIFSVKMEPHFFAAQQKLDRLNSVLQENIAGARLVKAFVRGEYEASRFETANEEFTDRTIQVMQFMASMSPALTVFVNLGMVLVIWYGGLETIKGNMMVGQIVAFINYLLTTIVPLTLSANLANVWANGLASAKRIFEVLDIEPEVPEAVDALVLPAGSLSQVKFEDVSFHFKGDGDLDVLNQINLAVESGETVAILGATGAGKSTLVNLIPRFYDATTGRVMVDNRDVRDLRENSLLSHVGIVPQETILFSGTIRENICYGCPDATVEEIQNAAKAAQAHDFIMSFPKGYETHVEERGVNLSGGQKQRIAIARALIMHPRILILDDATSSVDVETETKIQDALKEVMRDCSSVVVAQRISTVLNTDKIVVLDKGQIVAEGKHAELLKTSPIYQEIYDSQLGDGIHD